MIDEINKDIENAWKEQLKKRRLTILSSGLDIFVQKGYADTKIQDIARAANMDGEAVLYHFESKEKLYEELVKIGKSLGQSKFKDMETEPLQYFRNVAAEMFKQIEKYPFFLKMVLFMPQVLSNENKSEPAKKVVEYETFARFKEKIEQGQLNGTIKEGDPYALLIAFMGAIHGIAMLSTLYSDNHFKVPLPDGKWIVDIIKK